MYARINSTQGMRELSLMSAYGEFEEWKTDSTRHIAIIENCSMSAVGLQHLLRSLNSANINCTCLMILMALRKHCNT